MSRLMKIIDFFFSANTIATVLNLLIMIFFFSDGEKKVNGGVEKQNKDSNLSKQPEKTKDSCNEGDKKINGHLQICSNKKTLVKIVDLGEKK